MQKRSFVAGAFIFAGVALVLAALYFLLTPNAGEESGSLLKTVGSIFAFLLGAGASVQGWKGLFAKETPEPPAYQAEARGDGSQAISGENPRAIHVEGQGQYFEGGEHHHHEAALPQSDPNYFVPAPKSVYIQRGQIEEDVRKALRVNGVAAIVGVHAPGGLGKTELAKGAAHDLKGSFEDILWVDFGESTKEEVMARFLRQCALQAQPTDTYEMKRALLQGFLGQRALLVVLDDVRKLNAEALSDFLPPSPPCAALVTSRLRSFAAIPAQKTFPLGRMSLDEAQALFAAHLPAEVLQAEAEAVNALFERCQFNPLALEISARRIRNLLDFEKPVALFAGKVAQSLRALQIADDERLNLFAVFEASYGELDKADQARFESLAAFHASGFAPQAAAFLWELPTEESGHILGRFLRLSLLKTVPGSFERYRLHDLLDEYAAWKLEESGRGQEASARLAKWLRGFFNAHFTDDPATAPDVLLEMDNLRLAVERAIDAKNGDLLADLIYQARNWFTILNFHHEWFGWLASALQFGISLVSQSIRHT